MSHGTKRTAVGIGLIAAAMTAVAGTRAMPQLPAATGGAAVTDPSAPFFSTVAASIGQDLSTETPRASSPAATSELPQAAAVSRVGEPLPRTFPPGVLLWEEQIQQAAKELGIDPAAIAAVMTAECPSGNQNCTSSVGAMGLMQVMPGTARGIAAASGFGCSANPYDPMTSIRCGAHYFIGCMRAAARLWRPGHEVDMIGAAAAGYNGGPGYIPSIVAGKLANPGASVCNFAPFSESRKHCRIVTEAWLAAGRR